MLGLIALGVNLFSFGAVFAIAWAATWLLGQVVTLPLWVRTGLPWLLFNAYVVAGLFLTGDLPGAPRATAKLFGVAAAVSLLLGLVVSIWHRPTWALTTGSWAAAGALPWLLALVTDLIL